MTVQIGDKLVGGGEPTYVVAEIGGNHDGSLDKAMHLINAAAEVGADAAKFQLFDPDVLYPDRHTPGSIRSIWMRQLQNACWDEGLEFLCSVFDRFTLEDYLEIDAPAVKIASPEAVNLELLAACADTDMTVIVSTGAMTEQQVDATNLELAGRPRVLLHCVSAYPADPGDMNLGVIGNMVSRYAVPVGLSDHTQEPILAPMLAVAAGASMIEKHLTLDRSLPGPDHSFALEPWQFKAMVDSVRTAEILMGDSRKRVMPSEDASDRRVA